MAKYVLVQFDSDVEADDFVQAVRDKVTWEKGEGQVRAVYKKPTVFCECTAVKRRGFTRGKKFGWYVCTQCHKPTEAWAKGDSWFIALGVNLLSIQDGADEYRGPEHKQHDGFRPRPIMDTNLAADGRQQ
jgi:hypothetical protein